METLSSNDKKNIESLLGMMSKKMNEEIIGNWKLVMNTESLNSMIIDLKVEQNEEKRVYIKIKLISNYDTYEL